MDEELKAVKNYVEHTIQNVNKFNEKLMDEDKDKLFTAEEGVVLQQLIDKQLREQVQLMKIIDFYTALKKKIQENSETLAFPP